MSNYDVVVVGAGASGLMATALLCQLHLKIALLDSNEKAGKKLYLTGKGRCNITNLSNIGDFLENVVRGQRFLMSAINLFPPQATVEFFNSLGLQTVTERGNRVFPLSNKASDVTNSLLKKIQSCENTQIYYNHNVNYIKKYQNNYIISTKLKDFTAKCVILATGGKSYPLTGSNGNGYLIAKSLGHTIIEPLPSLTSIQLKSPLTLPQGLTLKNVEVTLKNPDLKVKFTQFGEMLFTQDGVSGPTILSLSSFFAPMCNQNNFKLSIDIKPRLSIEELDNRLLKDFSKNINKFIKNSLDELLPKSLIPFIIDYAKINQDKKLNLLTKQERENLLNSLKNLEFEVVPLKTNQQISYKLNEAIITCGGVELKQVNPKTMESKLNENLYLIGEMLDIDALTGGYNLQIAWSTAYSCANSILKKEL